MLKHLMIENYALISKLDAQFNDGLTVITGETGAGKSILLGALSMILGERADTGILLDKTKKCIIEGTFDLSNIQIRSLFEENDLDYESLSYFRREINPKGKSRAFVNDTPVTLQVMKLLSERLIDIHSQHESLMVGSSSFQFAVIDSYAGIIEKTGEYKTLFRDYRKKQSDLSAATEEVQKARADLDYYQYQLDELNAAKLDQEEYDRLEEELGIVKNAGEIIYSLEKSLHMLQESEQNVLGIMGEVAGLLKPLARFGKDYEDMIARLDSVMIETKDIAGELFGIRDSVQHDPSRADELESRLDTINRLLMKHNAINVKELTGIRDGFREKIDSASTAGERVHVLEREVDALGRQLKDNASVLSELRKKAIPDFENEITLILKELGMPGARFTASLKSSGTLMPEGEDSLRFLFNANVGGDLEDISRVASGGELSRVMLAIKSMISQKTLLPTIIFDEIDTGISGEISTRVGSILKHMSVNMQVIAITHLPQIASRGKSHLLVYKQVENGKTHTHLKALEKDERISEVAKMLGGKKPSDSMVETAKELIFNREH